MNLTIKINANVIVLLVRLLDRVNVIRNASQAINQVISQRL